MSHPRVQSARDAASATPASAAGKGTASPTLRQLPLDRLRPHPDHPRAELREDVVAGIAANLGSEYPREHAVVVRPVGDWYQIVSGHLRVDAALRKGLTHVWAWVEEMDDTTAFIRLITDNRQAELSPLEIGLHALKAVTKAGGGRGKRGGVSAYAAQVGYDEAYVRRLIKGAEVIRQTPDLSPKFLQHAGHLAAVHQTHPSVWPVLVPLILKKDWSVKETEDAVEKVTEVFPHDFSPTGSPWWGLHLPPDSVAARLATRANALNCL